MRSRFIALIFLIVFAGFFLGFYWFFYKTNISSLVILSESDEAYTVELEGKVSYEYFPILDKVFHYKSICTRSCEFSPIPPLNYSIRISTSEREPILDNIILDVGATYRYTLELAPRFSLEKIGEIPDVDADSVTDASRRYLLTPQESGNTLISSIDGLHAIRYDAGGTIEHVSYDRGIWAIRTSIGLFVSEGDTWKKNPRFTHMIDISPRYRVGYIDKNDEKLLSLANLEKGISHIILLDRESTEMIVLKKGLDMTGFLRINEKNALISSDGSIYSFDIKKLP